MNAPKMTLSGNTAPCRFASAYDGRVVRHATKGSVTDGFARHNLRLGEAEREGFDEVEFTEPSTNSAVPGVLTFEVRCQP
jgi:hypothetical protein